MSGFTQEDAIKDSYTKAIAFRQRRNELLSQREKQELAQLKKKYGSDVDEDDLTNSESSETEDEDGEELTPAASAALLRTLARIQKRDPAIYNAEKAIYEEEERQAAQSTKSIRKARKEKTAKPITYKSQAAAGLLGDAENDMSPPPLTHVQEQAALRSETISAFHGAIDEADAEDDDDAGGLLVLRKDLKDDDEMEEEEYKEFMKQTVGDVKELLWVDHELRGVVKPSEEGPLPSESKGKGKDRRKDDPADAEGFLADYILNRGWIDRSERRLPTYDEVTTRKSKKRKLDDDDAEPKFGDANVDDDDSPNELDDVDSEFEDLEEDFEATYNFRYEEPDGTKIPRHPREISSLVRRQESKRKDARQRRQERKDEELRRKKEEVRRMKNLKMKDIREKLQLIGDEGGLDMTTAKATLEALDLEADFDEAAHDRQMATLYGNDNYYAEADEEKPVWDDDLGSEDYDYDVVSADHAGAASASQKKKNKKKKKKKGGNDEDEGVDVDEMDAEAEVAIELEVGNNGPIDAPAATKGVPAEEEEWDGTEEMRKQVLRKYMDEVYGMDFNDVVAGIPTRFKYGSVPKASFSLSAADVLMATDKELNEYVGMKAFAPHKKGRAAWDRNLAPKLGELKRNLSKREWGYTGLGPKVGLGGIGTNEKKKTKNGVGKTDGKGLANKRKGKKERERERLEEMEGPSVPASAPGSGFGGVAAGPASIVEARGAEAEPKKKKRKRNKTKATE
ncbi:hypothetical protein FRB94_012403 [Tulasnella sp. JGI-2019a]|nr:hypothetical protein FRB93_010468 [Tulasnella sp. JGI-2019a]KAG9009131.1 hypothetical protein FRB94_012403 [Tulasnella sp. JGI-2019a]